MVCELNYDELIVTIKEGISREASQAYTAEGVSLYDAIKWTSRDGDHSKRLMADVLALIKIQCERFVCDVDQEVDGDIGEVTTVVITFHDNFRRIGGREETINTLLRSLIVNAFLNKYFVGKNQTELAAKYGAMAEADIKSLNTLLFAKRQPIYPV